MVYVRLLHSGNGTGIFLPVPKGRVNRLDQNGLAGARVHFAGNDAVYRLQCQGI